MSGIPAVVGSLPAPTSLKQPQICPTLGGGGLSCSLSLGSPHSHRMEDQFAALHENPDM